jgi:hypothetical protein
MKKLFNKKKAYKDFVAAHMHNILYISNLDDYELFFLELEKDNENSDVCATMEVDYEYLRAKLACDDKYFDKQFKAKNYKDLIHVLCHEAAHIITSELPDLVGLDYKGQMKFYLERATERTGRLINRLYSNWMEKHKIKIETGKGK